MRHGIIFWGNSHHSNSIFKIQKTIRRIITNAGSCDSCHQLYKQLQILSLTSQCIFSLLVFINKKRGLFLSNSEIHDMNTRFNYNLHLSSIDLTLVQKGVLYSGSKIYNHLPLNINGNHRTGLVFHCQYYLFITCLGYPNKLQQILTRKIFENMIETGRMVVH